MWLISIYYREYGPFNLSELAERACNRKFGWDMYVYRFPKDNVWRPARDVPEIREILLKHFPLKKGDMGPAGGCVYYDNANSKLYEVSPADAGYCSWENAERTCKNFSFNGFNDWRLPSPKELSEASLYMSDQIRQKRNIEQTNEHIYHWSNKRDGNKASAVITCIVEDKYEPSSGGTANGKFVNKDGIVRGNEKPLPVTEWHPVRPVRDLKK